jgi:hypothetical protein
MLYAVMDVFDTWAILSTTTTTTTTIIIIIKLSL